MVPPVLATNSSLFIQWSYPELLTHPKHASGNLVEIKNVVIEYIAIEESICALQTQYRKYPETMYNITQLIPNTNYNITINIFYDNPTGFKGIDIFIPKLSTRSKGIMCVSL